MMFDPAQSERLGELAAQITSYLAAHPNARDTVEGVHRWWLTGTDATSDEVSAALNYLVSLGRVERVDQQFQRREHD